MLVYVCTCMSMHENACTCKRIHEHVCAVSHSYTWPSHIAAMSLPVVCRSSACVVGMLHPLLLPMPQLCPCLSLVLHSCIKMHGNAWIFMIMLVYVCTCMSMHENACTCKRIHENVCACMRCMHMLKNAHSISISELIDTPAFNGWMDACTCRRMSRNASPCTVSYTHLTLPTKRIV